MLKLIEQEGVQEDTRQFSLEKDGRQIGTAQCQGNTVCSFQLDAPWDREDYAKYFLKQLLHRLDAYQGGEVRLSPELPERELFCELGFVPWEGGWVRRQHRQLHSLDFSHELMGACIRPGDLAVDATAGNGGDTEFLCRLVGEQGRVIAMDIQPQAVKATRDRLEKAGLAQRAQLLCGDHGELCAQLEPNSAAAVVFNFGWLPGGDHHRFTVPRTSIPALEGALRALKPGGRIIASLYHGRENGQEEKDTLLSWFGALPQEQYTVITCGIANRQGKDPVVVLVQKER